MVVDIQAPRRSQQLARRRLPWVHLGRRREVRVVGVTELPMFRTPYMLDDEKMGESRELRHQANPSRNHEQGAQKGSSRGGHLVGFSSHLPQPLSLYDCSCNVLALLLLIRIRSGSERCGCGRER